MMALTTEGSEFMKRNFTGKYTIFEKKSPCKESFTSSPTPLFI